MASATKKGANSKKANLRRREVKKSPAEQMQTITELRRQLAESLQRESATAIENVRLFQELKQCKAELTEALEQQTATGEILRVIASSPTDIQPVLRVVAENAARLCDATDAIIYRTDGNGYRHVAWHGTLPIAQSGLARPLIRGLPPGRAMIDREVIHIADQWSPEAQAEFPEGYAFSKPLGVRTLVAAPLLREEAAVGAILIRHRHRHRSGGPGEGLRGVSPGRLRLCTQGRRDRTGINPGKEVCRAAWGQDLGDKRAGPRLEVHFYSTDNRSDLSSGFKNGD